MGRHRAVESDGSGTWQKRSRSPEYGDRYSSRYSISRPSSAQASSSLLHSMSPAALAKRFTQLKEASAEVSRSVVHYPYAWLAATWLVLVFVGGVAAVALFKIDEPEPQGLIASSSEPSAASLSEQPQSPPEQNLPSEQQDSRLLSQNRSSLTPQSEQRERLPLFALGTVAFSCAIGCLWLSYRLTARPTPSQTRFPSSTPRLPRRATTTRRSIKREIAPAGTSVARAQANSSDASPVPTATLASHESHPLDWDEPSLADNLDIRQQRPLSHWL